MSVQGATSHSQPAGFRAAVGSWLDAAHRRMLNSRSRRRAVTALRALDDRMLRDIGLHRAHIIAADCLGHSEAPRRTGAEKPAGFAQLNTGAGLMPGRAPLGEFPKRAERTGTGRNSLIQHHNLAA